MIRTAHRNPTDIALRKLARRIAALEGYKTWTEEAIAGLQLQIAALRGIEPPPRPKEEKAHA